MSAFIDWDKTDIVKYVSKVRDYRTYLEICTTTTGCRFAKIDQGRFDVCHRLMYRCPDEFADGLNINFRAPDLDISQCIAEINRNGLRYDAILVDPWHEYDSSLRDMRVALSLLSDAGSIVIHDCCPPTDDIISPTFIPGSWCGVTFIAYIDFVTQNDGLKYRTVDTDFGCGVIQRRCKRSDTASQPFLFRDAWNLARNDPKAAFQFMQKWKFTSLNLNSVEQFVRSEAEEALMMR